MSRIGERGNTLTASLCKSCGAPGHTSKRSPVCPNHDLPLLQLLNRDFDAYQRYALSIPLDSFITNNNNIQSAREKIILQSAFLREVVCKAQLFINYYILRGVLDFSVGFFDQNFWYRVCRDLSITAIKNVVYGHLRDNSLIKPPALFQIPNQILPENTAVIIPELSTFLNEIITPVCYRLPTIPVTRATLTKNPQEIISVLRFILNIYAQQHRQQVTHQQPEQPEQAEQEQQAEQQQQK
ncbi:unnamed protein product [Rhizopus stolonifer]